MCESIQGENIKKNPRMGVCRQEDSKPRGSTREFPWRKTENHAKTIAMAGK